jgi:sucrose-6-phosphate hydrolase SacC (GH32 family)
VNQSNNRFIVLGYNNNNNAQIYISKDGDNWKESILSNEYSDLGSGFFPM